MPGRGLQLKMATMATVLDQHGIDPSGEVLRNPTTAQLYMHALGGGAGQLAEGGPLVVDTGRFTGRSPQDKFVVREPGSEDRIGWGRSTARSRRRTSTICAQGRRAPLRPAAPLRDRRLRGRGPDASARRAGRHRQPVPRALREDDVHSPTTEELDRHEPQALVLHAPEVEADPGEDGTRTGTFVVLHPTRGEI